jgi:hypothetical protein
VVALFPLWFIIEAAWKRKVRVALICLAACCVIIFPLLIRNYFASGWLLYPSAFPDLVHAEWKFDANDLDRFQHYITAYARFPVEEPATDQVLAMPLNQWTAIWWKNLTWADQALIILLGIAVAFDIIFLRQLARIVKKDLILCITILTIGVLVWFLKAPDPRFGSGFIQGLLYCLLIPWKEKGEGILKHGRRWIFSFLVFAFLASVLSYSIYRVSRYFDPKEIILPLGIKETKYRMIHCGNLEINLVNADSTECGSTTVPCSKDSCANFSPRGNGIEDGFRQRK